MAFDVATRIKEFVLAKIKSKQKNGFGIVGIVIVIAAIAILGGGGFFAYQYFSGGFACTQEAIRCPDGSIVGRTGLFCSVQCP